MCEIYLGNKVEKDAAVSGVGSPNKVAHSVMSLAWANWNSLLHHSDSTLSCNVL